MPCRAHCGTAVAKLCHRRGTSTLAPSPYPQGDVFATLYSSDCAAVRTHHMGYVTERWPAQKATSHDDKSACGCAVCVAR